MVTFLVRNLSLPGAFKEVPTITTSAGVADAGKVPNLDSTGKLDVSVIPTSGLTTTLQTAYNAGASITTTAGSGPVVIRGYTTNDTSFQIKDSAGVPFLSVSSDKKLDISTGEIRAEHLTSSEIVTVATNMSLVLVDSMNATVFRAIQYNYTVANSDNSGYESGRISIIQDGTTINLIAFVDTTIGTPCGITFSGALTGGNILLYATTDNSGSFSRILHLFKIALS